MKSGALVSVFHRAISERVPVRTGSGPQAFLHRVGFAHSSKGFELLWVPYLRKVWIETQDDKAVGLPA